MPRRKSRKEVESDSEDSSSPIPIQKLKRKKRKVTTNKDASAQKPRALLQSMSDMPVDVLLEIFKHLELVDVMHLSRTSKPLRSILMSRTSISVWKQAIANDGLPQCTKDLNEPKLAELMFGRSCDWCGRNVSGQEIIWAARVRSCKRCIDLAYEPANRNFENHRSYPAALAEHLPSVVVKNKRYIDIDLDRQWGEEYLKQSKDEASKWLEERVAERLVITKHADACHEWFKSRRENQVLLRKAIFIERLKERGWEEQAGTSIGTNTLARSREGMPVGIDRAKCVHSSGILHSSPSHPALASLDGVLDRFMAKVKGHRLDRERKEFFQHMLERLRDISREYSLTLPPDHLFPNTADIYFHPTVKEALSAVEADEALEEALTIIRQSLPGIVDDCLKLSKQQLANLVIDEYTMYNKPFDLSVLALASTLFHCKRCQLNLTLDQSVTHKCYEYYGYFVNEDADARAVRNAINEVTTEYKIQTRFSFSLTMLEPFTSVLHSCGIDPTTITAADMNAIDPVVECLACSSIKRGRTTMNWLLVPKHLTMCRHRPYNMSVLDEPEAEIVRARMVEQYQMATASTEDHICVHCRDCGGSMALMQHVKEHHQIDSPVYGQDVIVSPRAVTFRQEFSLWPPRL